MIKLFFSLFVLQKGTLKGMGITAVKWKRNFELSLNEVKHWDMWSNPHPRIYMYHLQVLIYL